MGTKLVPCAAMRWEYGTLDLKSLDPAFTKFVTTGPGIERSPVAGSNLPPVVIAALGDEGWELVGVEGSRLWFKRPAVLEEAAAASGTGGVPAVGRPR